MAPCPEIRVRQFPVAVSLEYVKSITVKDLISPPFLALSDEGLSLSIVFPQIFIEINLERFLSLTSLVFHLYF